MIDHLRLNASNYKEGDDSFVVKMIADELGASDSRPFVW